MSDGSDEHSSAARGVNLLAALAVHVFIGIPVLLAVTLAVSNPRRRVRSGGFARLSCGSRASSGARAGAAIFGATWGAVFGSLAARRTRPDRRRLRGLHLARQAGATGGGAREPRGRAPAQSLRARLEELSASWPRSAGSPRASPSPQLRPHLRLTPRGPRPPVRPYPAPAEPARDASPLVGPGDRFRPPPRAQGLAWAGGIVTVLGVFFFVLAVNRGWIGPVERVGLGALASLLVFAGGLWLTGATAHLLGLRRGGRRAWPAVTRRSPLLRRFTASSPTCRPSRSRPGSAPSAWPLHCSGARSSSRESAWSGRR